VSTWRGGGSVGEAEARNDGPAARRIAAELEALRRVATLVSGRPRPEEVFSAVAAEVGRLLMVDVAVLVRYDPARIDYERVSGPIGDVAHDWRIRSSLGVPIIVEGRPWGGMIVAFTSAATI